MDHHRNCPDEVRAIFRNKDPRRNDAVIGILKKLESFADRIPPHDARVLRPIDIKARLDHVVFSAGPCRFVLFEYRGICKDIRSDFLEFPLWSHGQDPGGQLLISMLCHVEFSVDDHAPVVELRTPVHGRWRGVSVVECNDSLFDALWRYKWRDRVEVHSEFLEILPLEYVPVTVAHGTSELLWESVQTLDIVRVALQEDFVIGIERLYKGVVIHVVVFTRFAIDPSLFHPCMPLPSRVGSSEEIGSHPDLRSTQG